MAFTFATTNVGGDPQGRGGATVALNDIVVSGSSISIPNHTVTLTAGIYNPAGYVGGNVGVYMQLYYDIYINGVKKGSCSPEFSGRTISNSSGWASTSASSTEAVSTSGSQLTSSIFSASNPTVRSVPITLKRTWLQVGTSISSGFSGAEVAASGSANLILNAPPTYTLSSLTIDTAYIYTGLTTASVTVSNLSAKYGGTISDITFTIGNTSVSRTDAGTLSILLDTIGTFTPTVTVTDSRGQTTTKTLDQITVNGYVAPSISFTAERTLASGVPDDEGTYATVDATLTFTDVVADAVAPSVVLTDENGTQTTPSVTWYSNRASDGTLSGSVTWANLSSGAKVYGRISGLNTNYSYQISIRPRDSKGTGTAIVQTVSSAFYTVDFLAGGHGIAFGMPASAEGFYCNMNAHFVDAHSVMRSLFDFIHPVGSYYETSDTSFNPNTTWGGVWVLEAEGQVHVSAGTNYAVNGALTNASDGGEATHELTIDEMPSHSHGMLEGGFALSIGTTSAETSSGFGTGNLWGNTNKRRSSITYTGGTQAHNNMQPYIIVNRWHRTA